MFAPDRLADADVPGFWQRLGLPGLADVHVHFLPERMLRRVWAHFDEASPLIGRPWPIRYRGSDEERVARLEALGVRHFTALAYAHRPAMAADLNEWTLAFAARTPGCVPCATFYPEPGVLAYVQDALDRGARVFKVHLQVGDFAPDHPLLTPVWRLLAERRTPVVIHAGGHPVPNAHTGPEPFGRLLRQHPELTAVVAHLGVPDYEPFLAYAERYPYVCLDTTMAFTDFVEERTPFPRDLLPRLTELGSAGKVVLGSDFPNIPYPYGHQLEALARLELGDAWLRAVCWENPERLLNH